MSAISRQARVVDPSKFPPLSNRPQRLRMRFGSIRVRFPSLPLQRAAQESSVEARASQHVGSPGMPDSKALEPGLHSALMLVVGFMTWLAMSITAIHRPPRAKPWPDLLPPAIQAPPGGAGPPAFVSTIGLLRPSAPSLNRQRLFRWRRCTFRSVLRR
jgi:hypothetical protein